MSSNIVQFTTPGERDLVYLLEQALIRARDGKI